MTGTLINIVTVLLGSLLGLILRNRLPESFKLIILQGIGLITLVIGMQMALKTENVLIMLGSLLLGGLTGQAARIELRLDKGAEYLKSRFSGREDKYFSEGLITASIIFCVGPMTILGSINDGLRGDYELLAVKSVLDGFTSIALSATFGIGVLFSVFVLAIIQGGLSLGAGILEPLLNNAAINEMTAVGGVMIIAIGFVILEVRKLNVANFLPALIYAPLLLVILDAWGGI
jgi:uncharacterized membrane protein YqgA involved in biofilm formation